MKDALRYLSDPVTMRFIELPFDEEKTKPSSDSARWGKIRLYLQWKKRAR